VKRFLPDTLVGRTLLVLIAGLVLSQLAGVVLYSFNRSELASRLSGRQTAERIVSVVQLVQATAEPERGRVLQAMDVEGLRIGWGVEPLVQEDDRDGDGAEVLDELRASLKDREIHATLAPPPPPPMQMEPPNDDVPAPGNGMRRGFRRGGPLMRVAVHLDDGSWLNFLIPPHHDEPLRPGFFGPLAGGLLVVMLLSVLAVRRAAKPLAVLAAAAQRLGRDVAAPPVPVNGPREVRAAAQAFNEMQIRLRRFIDDRTQMVAAISHDLRTPITRMKLRAEFVDDDDQRNKMLVDLDEMEAMIAATLAFARDDAAREARQSVDLAPLLAELCAQFGATYSGPDSLTIAAGPTGLKRAFANLLDNAAKYGGGAALELSTDDSGHVVVVVVEDDGPGIPVCERERVFAPFYRIEASRNRETGGTGLGLAVARSAVRAHGGDIVLDDSASGGLRATVTLPR
jgi:signal transduction histidine kinase